MTRSCIFLGILVIVIAGFTMPRSLTVSASSRTQEPAGNKVCKTITKKVHGKKKRVKVCKLVKPTPSPTPVSTFGTVGYLHGTAVDVQGNVFVVARESGYLLRMSPNGQILAKWPVPPDPKTFAPPDISGVALDVQGDIYLSDSHNYEILKLSPQGKVVGRWDTAHKQQGLIDYGPGGPAVDGQGNVYITNWDYGDVEKYSPSGRLVLSFGAPCPMLAGTEKPVCSDAKPFVAPGCDAPKPVCADATTIPPGEFNHPYGLGLDTHGNIYVSDHYNRRIVKFSPSGEQLAVFGSELPAPYGSLSVTEGVAVDGQGNVYNMVGGATPRVVKFSPTGQPVAQWVWPAGSFPVGDAGVDADDNIYVTLNSATGPSTVVKLSPELQLLQEWK